MKKQFNILFFLLIGMFITTSLLAQEKIVKITDLELVEGTSPANQSIVFIYSPIEQLDIKSNMGDECNTKPTAEVDGSFKYTLVIQYSDDELDGTEVLKRILKIGSDYGQTDLTCRLSPGKQYKCSFTVPPEFAYADESISGGMYASDKARVSISSGLINLNIYYNDIQVLKRGVIETSLPSFLSIKKEDDNYHFLFTLDGEQINQSSFKRPIFKVQHTTDDGDSNELEIQLKENVSIGPKANFKFRVFYKNIIGEKEIIVTARDLSFEELLQKARQLEEKHNFLAAANTYQSARDHVDCPLEKKQELLDLKKKAANSEGYMRIIQKYENKLGEIIQTNGFEHESAYDCCRMIVLSNQKLCEYYPADIELKEDLEIAKKKLYKHPKSETETINKIVKEKQQIQGIVTKDHSYKDRIPGTEIFAITKVQYEEYKNCENYKERKKFLKKEKNGKRMTLLGRVGSNNSYVVKFKPEKGFCALYFCGQLELSDELFPFTSTTEKLDVKLIIKE